MQNKKNQSGVGMMIQRCHKWRQRRKQYMDQARQTSDVVERERLLQMAEHFGRQVSAEQGKIDAGRDVKDKSAPACPAPADIVEEASGQIADEEESDFPDFIQNLK